MMFVYLLLIISATAMALQGRFMRPIVFKNPRTACYKESTDGTPIMKLYAFPEEETQILTILATLPKGNISLHRKYTYQPSQIQLFQNATYIPLVNCKVGREDFKICFFSIKNRIFTTTKITAQAFNGIGCTYKVFRRTLNSVQKV